MMTKVWHSLLEHFFPPRIFLRSFGLISLAAPAPRSRISDLFVVFFSFIVVFSYSNRRQFDRQLRGGKNEFTTLKISILTPLSALDLLQFRLAEVFCRVSPQIPNQSSAFFLPRFFLAQAFLLF